MAFKYVDDAAIDNSGDGNTPATAKKWLWLNIGTNDALFTDSVNAPAAGDVVLVLSGHDENHGYNSLALSNNGAENAPINVITVDDLSNPTALGAKANSRIWQGGSGSGPNLSIASHLNFQGFEIHAFDELYVNGHNQYKNCRLRQGRSGPEDLDLVGNAKETRLIDTDVVVRSAGRIIISNVASSLIFEGGQVISMTGTPNGFSTSQEGGRAKIYGVDLSAMTNGVFSGLNSEASGPYNFHRCKLPAVGNIFPTWNDVAEITYHGCDIGDGYYWFGEGYREGTIVCDTFNARTASYDGTNTFSALMQTGTDVAGDGKGRPLRFKLVSIPAVDLTTAQTITVQLSQYNAAGAPAALTDHEFFIGVEYPDATDLALGRFKYSNEGTGLFESGTPLESSTETWDQVTNVTNQQVSVDLPAVPGADNATITVWVYFDRQNAEVNVCPDVDVSAT